MDKKHECELRYPSKETLQLLKKIPAQTITKKLPIMAKLLFAIYSIFGFWRFAFGI